MSDAQEIHDQVDSQPLAAQPSPVPVCPRRRRFDVVVVGADCSALEAANTAVQLGRSVALVTTGDTRFCPEPIGPRIYRALERFLREEVDLHRLRGRRVDVPMLLRSLPQVPGLRPDDLSAAGVDILPGQARFLSKRTILADGDELSFRAAIVVPRRRAAPSRLIDCQEGSLFTEDSLLELRSVPARLAVMGSGPKACRWAHLFCRLGTEVHLIAPAGQLLPEHEPEFSHIVREQFLQEGIRLHLSCPEVALESMGNCTAITLMRPNAKEKLLVDEILDCPPELPALDELDLQSAGVRTSSDGIAVDRWLRTSNPRVFAVCGDPEHDARVLCAAAQVAAANASARPLWRPGYRPFEWHLVPGVLRLRQEMVSAGISAGESACHAAPRATYQEAITGDGPRDLLRVTVEALTGRPLAVMAVAASAEMWLVPLMVLMKDHRSVATLTELPAAGSPHVECLRRIGRRWAADLQARYGSGLRGSARLCFERAGQRLTELGFSRR